MRMAGLLSCLAILCLAGCADDPETTPAPTAADLQERGDYAVGFQELEFTYDGALGTARTIPIKVWYPATEGGEEAATYAVAGIVEVPANGALAAPNVAGETSFPLAVYSHGSGGDGLLAYPYGELMASQGWIVISPNHIGNTALDGATMMFDAFPNIAINRAADITAAIDWAADSLPGDLAGKARTDEVFMFGHSFGAYTTFAAGGVDLDYDTMVASCAGDSCDAYMASGVEAALQADLGDPRIVAIAPQSPALVPFYANGEAAALTVPTLLMSGKRDITLTEQEATLPAWAALDNPDDLWVDMPDGAHLTFISICDDLDDSVLGLFQPNYLDDGCGDSFTPVSEAVPALAAYVLGFARQHILGEDWNDVLRGEPIHPSFVISTH